VNAPKDAPADGDVLFNSMSSFDKSIWFDGIPPGTFKQVGHRTIVPRAVFKYYFTQFLPF
jgi:hypothetical protein